MTVVGSKEFANNQKKYFDLAVNEDVCIKRGKNIFHLTCNTVDKTSVEEDVYLEPDDDFRRAITMDELLNRVLEDVDKMFVNK